jgi:hypothetical protein
VSDASLFDRPIVITNATYRFMVLEQLAEISIEADVLLEPVRRDSGPAIAAGAAFAQTRDRDAVVLALAADHVVRDTPAFVAACRQGLVAAEAGRIVTFGIKPERAATEYGYINPGEVVSGEVRSVAELEAGRGEGRRIHQSRLSLEQRQLHVPRLSLGFDFNSDECKIMGLAPCGNPARYRHFFEQAVELPTTA